MAKAHSSAGRTPETVAKLPAQGTATGPAQKDKYKPVAGNFILIHVTKILDFAPLSKPSTTVRALERSRQISDLASVFSVPLDSVVLAFARYLAAVLRERVQWAVKTQMVNSKPMKAIYKPLNPRYQRTKVPRNRDRFWINTDFLIKSLRVWKYSGEVYLGYPATVLHAAKRTVYAADIMGWVEGGTKNADGSERMPSRPLFRPIVGFLSKNIKSYWIHFSRRLKSKDPVFLKYLK